MCNQLTIEFILMCNQLTVELHNSYHYFYLTIQTSKVDFLLLRSVPEIIRLFFLPEMTS